MSEHAPANADLSQVWGGTGGNSWVDMQESMDGQLLPMGQAALDAAQVKPGERVLDVGCGCGATTLALAAAVGSSGSVVGCEISEPMLARAVDRGAAAGLAQANFVLADAQTSTLGGPFDVVYSRFGVMFFDDPTAAFVNLRSATRAGGCLAFVCWHSPRENEWMSGIGAVGNEILGPPEPMAHNAPGPFAFSDHDYVRSILEGAGWSNVELADCRRLMHLFGTNDLDVATTTAMRIGGIARRLANESESTVTKLRDAIHSYLADRWTDSGWHTDGIGWVVTASN